MALAGIGCLPQGPSFNLVGVCVKFFLLASLLLSSPLAGACSAEPTMAYFDEDIQLAGSNDAARISLSFHKLLEFCVYESAVHRDFKELRRWANELRGANAGNTALGFAAAWIAADRDGDKRLKSQLIEDLYAIGIGDRDFEQIFIYFEKECATLRPAPAACKVRATREKRKASLAWVAVASLLGGQSP
jgi:hypothetical protein